MGWDSFFSSMVSFGAVIVLCFIPVRDRIKVSPPWGAVALWSVVTVIYLAAVSPMSLFVQTMVLPVYYALFFLYYRRVVDLSGQKLLFLLMTAANYNGFTTSFYYTLKLDSPVLHVLVNALVVVLSIGPTAYVLGHYLREAILDLEDHVWRYIWVFPLCFTISIHILTHVMAEAPVAQHGVVRILSLLYTFSVYLAILSILRSTVVHAKETERARAAESHMALTGERYRALAKSIEQAKTARHDLRHHLVAINQYLHNREIEDAIQYCNTLIGGIATSGERQLCENFAVDAVASHYIAAARRAGIQVDAALSVPDNLEDALNSDLCVVIGNLLENAVEACERMESGHRYINIRSRLHHSGLVITMDNSFNGIFGPSDRGPGKSGVGLGLRSVAETAGKYGGHAKYDARGTVFQSSVYMNLAWKDKDAVRRD